MRRRSIALSLVAGVTLMTELLLTRVFDVILYPNLGYTVITCAMFALGLAGVWAALRPQPPDADLSRFLSRAAAMYGLGLLALVPVLNLLPFDYEAIGDAPLHQLLWFTLLYLALVVPFFAAGLVFTTVFSFHPRQIGFLYFADLAGAAVGCVILVPFIPAIGPGGLTVCAGALAFLAAGLFSERPSVLRTTSVLAALLVAFPFVRSKTYLDFREHTAKRGVEAAKAAGLLELTHWDPISKIDVVNVPLDAADGDGRLRFKHIAYDGGSQSSHFYPFDGDLAGLRRSIEADPARVADHFWQHGVLASHWLMRDHGSVVLVIGSAGGQETKAALLYGAGRVDAVEMVGAVVEFGRGRYADFIGRIFQRSEVHVRTGEGRSFLRSSNGVYDIIQIFSNHTSSSIASGTGAVATTYLQTTDAYREYFEHLAPDGILHVNHHAYPRMITTAALAWRELGRSDFQRHVIVFERRQDQDNLPTMLIRMSPWTAEEVSALEGFFSRPSPQEPYGSHLVENPVHPEESFLAPVFYSGALPAGLVERSAYRIDPPTDDRPFFNFLRKRWGPVRADPTGFLNLSTAALLNSQLRKEVIPLDVAHFFVTGFVGIVFVLVFVLVPLFFSEAGLASWPGRAATLLYFSCLGTGFIVIELVLIQIFMKLVGYPLYAYSTVIFTLLLAAGVGSLSAARLGVSPRTRWSLPFAGVLATGVLLLLVYPAWFQVFLAAPLALRVVAAAVLLLPLGFFLGMPFPLGVRVLESGPHGSIAWAWGMNGLFTVLGGLSSALLALLLGFRATLLIGLAAYAVAFAVFARLRSAAP